MDIQGIFFDLGGTLRILRKEPEHQYNAMCKIAELVGTDMDPKQFHKLIDQRYDKYRDWAIDTNREAPEAELWTRWLAPEYPAERIAANAPELTYQYRQAKGKRYVIDGGVEVIDTLYKRGYTLGIISNLIGCHEIQDWLKEDGLEHYFKTVVLSSVTCIRKPDPAIYLQAVEEANVPPALCACVGDNYARDIIGAKSAGFGLNVGIDYPDNPSREIITDENRPDIIISDIRQLLDIFPKAPSVCLEAGTAKK